MLAKDIAELMRLIQREEARNAEKAKREGPAVKGYLCMCLILHCRLTSAVTTCGKSRKALVTHG